MDKERSLAEILKEFETIASLGYREIASFLPKDQIPMGFFCPYVPEELIHASGGFPLRLMGSPIQMSHVQAHLPVNCCHLVKSSLESLLQGELHFLKGVIFSHTCDAMQGLADIWAFQKRTPLQFNFMMPTRLEGDLPRSYLRAEMERLKAFLDSNVGKVTPSNLKASIHLFNRIREKIREIYVRKRSTNQFSETHFAEVIRAGHLMDRRHHLELLEALLPSIPEKIEAGDRVPIFLSGNMVHSPSFFSLIEEAGAKVVSDDLCSGARFLPLMVKEEGDLLDDLTERYFTSYLCPAKHKGVDTHIQTLLKEVETCGAKGVVFLLYKYCENHFFDYPDLKQALESKGIPTLLLEVEDPSHSIGQLKTRLQAFVEMLSTF